MKKILLLIPALIILAGCGATDNSNIPTPSASILDATENGQKVDCTQMPWKTNQRVCGPGHQIAR
jgi:uncharacterized lipoprotein YajG